MNDNLHQLRCFGCEARISGAVEARFAIQLEMEPVLVGF
jgi:hypothetical protein